MSYIDGYVVPVSTDKREAYLKSAIDGAAVFKEHGAVRVVETWGDDVPEGKLTSFAFSVKLEPGETVVFSWIEWPSKEARDLGMKKAMEDPRLTEADMPFDGKRMIYGGFEVLLDS
ncbi:MAG: RNA signal recognition particle [Asticcacaulis sp. 32-58-5]|nr:MAG: RNA signal recognition particle [Asticcacaulis sp. 32-58-5]